MTNEQAPAVEAVAAAEVDEMASMVRNSANPGCSWCCHPAPETKLDPSYLHLHLATAQHPYSNGISIDPTGSACPYRPSDCRKPLCCGCCRLRTSGAPGVMWDVQSAGPTQPCGARRFPHTWTSS
jgi:hypothetical protein